MYELAMRGAEAFDNGTVAPERVKVGGKGRVTFPSESWMESPFSSSQHRLSLYLHEAVST